MSSYFRGWKDKKKTITFAGKGFHVSSSNVHVDMKQVKKDIENALLLLVLEHLPHLQYLSDSENDPWEVVATDVRKYGVLNFNYYKNLFTTKFVKDTYFEIWRKYTSKSNLNTALKRKTYNTKEMTLNELYKIEIEGVDSVARRCRQRVSRIGKEQIHSTSPKLKDRTVKTRNERILGGLDDFLGDYSLFYEEYSQTDYSLYEEYSQTDSNSDCDDWMKCNCPILHFC